MDSREQRIATLATTLKSSGIAKSEAQAKTMAEDMIGVEDKVQKNYEERHAAAHEHIQTAKNLGDARVISSNKKPVPEVQKISPIGTFKSEPVISSSARSTSSRGSMSDDYPNVGGISLSGSSSKTTASTPHETHNALLEAIKAQVSREEIIPLYDQYMKKSQDALKPHVTSGSANDYVDYLSQKPVMNDLNIAPIGTSLEQSKVSSSESHTENHAESHVDEYVEIHKVPELKQIAVEEKTLREEHVPGKLIQELKLEVYHDELPAQEIIKDLLKEATDVANANLSKILASDIVAPEKPIVSDVQIKAEIEIVEIESDVAVESDIIAVTNVESDVKVEPVLNSTPLPSESNEAPKLDGAKLAELMEEDGPMEEHTREIKTKPENVKPKESYVEDTIDLASVFKFKR